MVRQVWIAASLKVRDLPLLPEGSASQFISGSNQIVSDPRRFSAVNRPLFAGDPEVRILGYGKEQMWKQIFTRGARTCCADGFRASRRI
jgi:hypothetical protein